MHPPLRDRFVSLDAFRGLTVAAMILVNSPGSWRYVHPPLLHADWHGWTFADLVFPAFLFILGAAIPLAFSRPARIGATSRRLHVRIARRTAILFVLGLLLNAFLNWFDPSSLRIPGVLQRIAVCYAAAALFVLHARPRTQAIAATVLLVGYWAVLECIAVPGAGMGGIDAKDQNLAAFVDRLVLSGHLYRTTWDPEGILSTLPAIATTLLGVFAGRFLLSSRDDRTKIFGLLGAGGTAIGLGLVWGIVFPINKNLWTSSYAVFTAGIAAVALAAFHLAIKGRALGWAVLPFAVVGMNPIVCYVGSSLLDGVLERWPVPFAQGTQLSAKAWIFVYLEPHFAAAENASLAYAIGYVVLWIGVAAMLHRRGIFVKI
jgi:predicted acyltransferase